MASVFETGSAALLRAISSPLSGWKRQPHSDERTDERDPPEPLGLVIEGDMIPRLMMQYSTDASLLTVDGEARVETEAAERFAPLPLQLEADELLVEVEAFLERGVSVEAIFVDLLAPSARRIGELWETDEYDFVEVTMGLWRLQEVMREIAARSPPVIRSLNAPRSSLFSPIPGDQHSFGALIIDEVFARAGWESEALIDPERRELLDLISEKSFDLVGLTLSSDCTSGPVAQIISAIRSVSPNPNLFVLIGGRAVNANPGMVGNVGADGTAADACAALDLAESLLEDVALRVQHAS